MEATLDQALKLGLTEQEFDQIKTIIGRAPNFNETAVYSVMWSEHCSYKNSIKYLKKLPREGSRLLVKAGEENAGLVDIGGGLAVVFKIESHNHPSAIEPFQGAATGVGGIHRDIFTMGARPIAAMNSLRFGLLDNDKTKHLLKGVVKGISHYGNCFGVPTVGGEVYFEDCYQTNPLVNAMSVGIVKVGQTFSATSYGAGNPVFIVGAATGKDGIGGASFASADITEDSAAQLPAVQVGDPFEEKKLLEACMELVDKDWVVGMQDMGAAGISCSTSEMSAKGEHGMEINLDHVPTRQQNMLAWEMLMSESQERMLIVIKKGHEEDVKKIFDRWDIHCEQIGVVTKDPNLKYYLNGELQADIPAESLVLGGGAPVYDRDFKEPAYLKQCQHLDIQSVPEPADLRSVAWSLVQEPNIASKRFIYDQYDSMVGTANASTNNPSDASLVRIHGTERGLAISVDCNSRYVYLDPYVGGMIAVSEAARNIACTGGTPVGITNCLNFGNPYNPEVYYQFVNALRGMTDACIQFDAPVTGGNVSFYNQYEKGPVYPTPTIGMVGVLDDLERDRMTLDFKKEGDIIFLLGKSVEDINGSEYLFKYHKKEYSPAPYFDLKEEAAVQAQVLELIQSKRIVSAHDVSEGGIFVTLFESAMYNNRGFQLHAAPEFRKDAFLFGEAQGRIIVSVPAGQKDAFLAAVKVPVSELGTVTNGSIEVFGEGWGSIQEWKEAYDTAIEKKLS